MRWYAHSLQNEDKSKWQPIVEHLEATSQLAYTNGMKFGCQQLAGLVGLLHDLGKYSLEFQSLLDGKKLKVDHSTAGAQEAIKLYGKVWGRIMAYVIAGHHAGLPDYGSPQAPNSLVARLQNTAIPNYESYKEELSIPTQASSLLLPIKPIEGYQGFSIQMFIRFLYSCLVDADFQDTERFYNPETNQYRDSFVCIREMGSRLEMYLEKNIYHKDPKPINKIRNDILFKCIRESQSKPGIFTLTVPTGGGKTISSLAFAVKHAMQNDMDRIIYVIPYISIIEQNAQVFREAVGTDAVIEHHSNFKFTDVDEKETEYLDYQKIRLATENWAAPLVVTTNVQFFESLFANKSSKCRKLHNISRSVIILDEAQMLPTDYLKPCLLALAELITNYHCSVVLCTATQPAIAAYLPEHIKPVEIAPEPEILYQKLKRVQVVNLGECSDKQLVARLSGYHQALCIVNTRAHALKLYSMLETPGKFHLSARMCPVHRSRKINEIKYALSHGQECRVISTQLIEAGVDVDFPVVFRSMCGLDSLAQAAGRCNREGKMPQGGIVYSFRPQEHGLPKGWLRRTAEIANMVSKQYDDPLSLMAINEYFQKLYSIEGEGLDRYGILKRIEEGSKELAFPFTWIAENFTIIDDNTSSVIIPYDEECRELLKRARYMGPNSYISRQLQPYTVQVYSNELFFLNKNHAITMVADHYQVLDNMEMYSEETGLGYGEEEIMAGDVLIM